jgi:hypothetical protein
MTILLEFSLTQSMQRAAASTESTLRVNRLVEKAMFVPSASGRFRQKNKPPLD